MGPHTSECTNPNNLVALSPYPTKGDLVIFLRIHDSQVDPGSAHKSYIRP